MRKRVFTMLITIFLVTFTVFIPASYAEEIKTIAVLPFKMNAAQDLTFLQEGIMDMLSSRLPWKDKIIVVEKELVKERVAELKAGLDKETALKIGKSLKADYVILGSVTVFGESVSLDAKILDVAKGEELVTAFNQSKGMDEVIPTVNKFAQDINAKILGRQLEPPKYVLAPQERLAREVTDEPGLIKGEKRDVGIGEAILTAKVPFNIVGLDVGDVNGDGRNDVVMIDHNNVYIYQFEGDRLVQSRKISGSRSYKYVSVDVADLNGNSKAEIYVSNIIGDSMGSFILEWSEGNFVSLASGERWFFRILNHPTKGESLIGQRRDISGSFTGGVYFLTLANEKIIKGERLSLTHKANVFNFTMGDMEGNGRIATAVLAENGDLILIGPDGEVDFKDEGNYGGSPNYIIDKAEVDGFHAEGQVVYLSPRLLMEDIDSDGKRELVLCRNELKGGRLFERIRLFKGGYVLFLRKTATGLKVRHQTGRLSNCVTDYQIKDINNDSRSELLVALTDPNRVTGKAWSQVVVYGLH